MLVPTIWSCRSVKTVSETNKETKTTEKKEIKKDSVNLTSVNKAIKDNISVSLRTNNKVVDSIIKQRLKGFISKKTSGSNSYEASFDYDKMVLDIATLIGETKDTNTETNTEQTTEKTFEEKTDEYISKKIRAIPWWFYALVIFWFF